MKLTDIMTAIEEAQDSGDKGSAAELLAMGADYLQRRHIEAHVQFDVLSYQRRTKLQMIRRGGV